MKTDVKTLIAALTTERNSLTKAIAVLQELDGGASPEKAVARVKTRMKFPNRQKRRTHAYDVAITQPIVTAMLAKPEDISYSRYVKRVSREYGIPQATILSGWKRWEIRGNRISVQATNGAEHGATTTTADAPVTFTNVQ